MNVKFTELLRVSLDIKRGESQSKNSSPREERVKVKFYLKSEDVIRENDNLIPTILMILNQELTRLKFLRVHTVEQHFLP